MSKFIEKNKKLAQLWRTALIVVFILFECYFIFSSLTTNEISFLIVYLLSSMLIVGWIVYWITFHQFMSNLKWLKEKGIEHIADDISLEQPTLPRSKIYCGRQSFFCKKPCAIIPYSEVAWVYLYERKFYGIITMEKSVIIYTKDGKRFAVSWRDDEFKWLLENFIIRYSPNVVLGFGAEQKKRYRELNPSHSEENKKYKRLWGIVLIAIAIVFAILMIAFKETADISTLLIFIISFAISGVVLYMLGNKKK